MYFKNKLQYHNTSHEKKNLLELDVESKNAMI